MKEASKNTTENRPHYLLGIDGGGTKTVFRLTDTSGKTVSTVYKGASNPNDIGMGNAIAVLRDGIAEACGEIPKGQITAFAGIAGGGMSGNNADILRRFFEEFAFFAFENGSDIENLLALSSEEKRVLVIMGTGFIVYAVNVEERKRISGWGQLFDEGGSGYTLGRDAIAAVLSAGDGSGKETLMTALLEAKTGESAEAHLTEFYRGGKRYIAEFAPLVFRAAEQNDPIALAILEKNTRFAAEKINAALAFLSPSDSDEIPVLFAGGISKNSEILFPMIEKHLTHARFRLILLKDEPITGAINRAKQIKQRRVESFETCDRR